MIVGWRRGSVGCVRSLRLFLQPCSRLVAAADSPRPLVLSASPERTRMQHPPLRVPPNGTNSIRFAQISSQQAGESEDPGRHRVFTVPNALCVFRIGLTPVIGSLVLAGSYSPALSLFVVAAFTDMLDGLIARNVAGQKSLLGSVLDPVADKLLVGTLFVTCTYVALIPVPLTALVLTRDVSLIVGGFYKRYATMARPITLARFFDSKVSSMQIVPTLVSKVNTMLQLSVVTLALVVPIVAAGPQMDYFFAALCASTGVTTLWSGLQYTQGKAFKRI